MLDNFGTRQQELLRTLAEHKEGLTVDDLVTVLEVSRTAVNQHVRTLERDGYVKRGALQKTGGRPGSVYELTQKGQNIFPKQYSWFSELLLDSLKEEMGSEQLEVYLRKVARAVAAKVKPGMTGKPLEKKIVDLAGILTELSYQASIEQSSDAKSLPIITATNCVYHDLAVKHPEVCEFDIALMSNVLDSNVEHLECMVRDGTKCRFQVHSKNTVTSLTVNDENS